MCVLLPIPTCTALDGEWRQYLTATEAVASIDTALYATTNRYSTAANALDSSSVALQAGVFKTYLGMLASAMQTANSAAQSLHDGLQQAGIDFAVADPRKYQSLVDSGSWLSGLSAADRNILTSAGISDQSVIGAVDQALQGQPDLGSQSLVDLLGQPIDTTGYSNQFASLVTTDASAQVGALAAQSLIDSATQSTLDADLNPAGGPPGAAGPCAGRLTQFKLDVQALVTNPFAQQFLLKTADGINANAANCLPTVTEVSPNSGPEAGGNSVKISGANLANASDVSFSGTSSPAFTCTATACTATAPAGHGTVDVTVTIAAGTSGIVSADEYTYTPQPTITGVSPAAGPAAGGQTVIIKGANLGDVTEVNFGGQAAAILGCTDTSCSVTNPPGSGTVNVVATAPAPEGASPHTAAGTFTYLVPSASTNLLTSGDFEPGAGIPDVSASGFSQIPTGSTVGAWSVSHTPGTGTDPGGVELVNESIAQPYTGSQFLKFGELDQGDASAPAQIQQTVTTVPGHQYELDFAMSGQPEGDPTIKRLQVALGDVTQIFTFDITGHTRLSMGWESERFIADSCATAMPVTLAQLDAGTRGPQVNNVQLFDLGPITPDPCTNPPPAVTGVSPSSGRPQAAQWSW